MSNVKRQPLTAEQRVCAIEMQLARLKEKMRRAERQLIAIFEARKAGMDQHESFSDKFTRLFEEARMRCDAFIDQQAGVSFEPPYQEHVRML